LIIVSLLKCKFAGHYSLVFNVFKEQMIKARKKSNSFSHIIRKIILWILIVFFGSTLFFTLLYKFVPPPVTPLMIIRLFEQKKAGKPLTLQKRWVSLKDISGYMPAAVITCEDQHFLTHHGFDIKAIKKAQQHNARSKKKRGASTISQQTAKNVFLWPKRSWFRKGMEVYFTLLIEGIWGKKRIMEVYLNVIETGDGIYGVEKAAQHYFHKNAGTLTKREAALIAVCLPNPLKMKPNKLTGYRLRRLSWAMRQINYFYPVEFDKKKRKETEKQFIKQYKSRPELPSEPDPMDEKPEEFLDESPVLPGEVIENIGEETETIEPDSLLK